MSDLIHVHRQSPNGDAVEIILAHRDGVFSMTSAGEERPLDAADVLSALKAAPEITTFGPSDHTAASCADDRARAALVASLIDQKPETDFDESLWPDDAAPAWDEWPDAESVLRRRWIEIDRAEYHPLALTDRTRIVRYDADRGEIESGEVLVTAQWRVESEVTSSESDDSLSLISGDVLLSRQRGDAGEASIEVVAAGTLAERIASWLADNTYAPAAVISLLGVPAAGLERVQRVVVDQYLAPAVLDALCRGSDGCERLRLALTDPGSDAAASLTAELADEEEAREVLARYI